VKAGRSNPSATPTRHSFACRDGGRHPGRLEGDALRGASSERRPRFGPSIGSGSSTFGGAPTTADVLWSPRRGTPSAYALTKRRQPCARTRDRRQRRGDASFTRSRDPCTSILTMLRSASFGGGAFESGITVGQTRGDSRGTSTGAAADGRSAARRRSPFSQESSVVGQKRKGIMVPVPARNESRGLVARTSKCSCRSR